MRMLRLGRARPVEACKLQLGPSHAVLRRMLRHSRSVVSREGWKRGVRRTYGVDYANHAVVDARAGR